jgi:hypothetical protein
MIFAVSKGWSSLTSEWNSARLVPFRPNLRLCRLRRFMISLLPGDHYFLSVHDHDTAEIVISTMAKDTPSQQVSTRRKSCVACVKAKRRCDLQNPLCTRCNTRGLLCNYVSMVETVIFQAQAVVWSFLLF